MEIVEIDIEDKKRAQDYALVAQRQSTRLLTEESRFQNSPSALK